MYKNIDGAVKIDLLVREKMKIVMEYDGVCSRFDGLTQPIDDGGLESGGTQDDLIFSKSNQSWFKG